MKPAGPGPSEVFFTVLIDGGRWSRVEGLGGNCPLCLLRLVRKFVAVEWRGEE